MMIYVDADEIVHNLWQGSFPDPGDAVARSGFKLLILCSVEDQEPAESYPGVEVVHAPNHDDGQHKLNREVLEIALKAAHQVADAVNAGQRVLVTCQAGLNRSGLVTALALHLLYGWKGSVCVDRVRAKRKPLGHLHPLCNYDFVRALMRLEARPPFKKGSGTAAPCTSAELLPE